MSANPTSEQYAENASCSAALGMPSEEELLRALNAGWRDGDEFDSSASIAAILALIRPAFEAKDARADRLVESVGRLSVQLDAAEAKLAQAVEAMTTAHVAMTLAAALPSVSSEYDFSDAIAGTEAVLRACSASAAARGVT